MGRVREAGGQVREGRAGRAVKGGNLIVERELFCSANVWLGVLEVKS